MTENIENIENIENKQIDDVLEELKYLRHRNEFLERVNKGIKLNNSKLTVERNTICDKLIKANQELAQIKNLSMFEFAEKYCTESTPAHDTEIVCVIGSLGDDY